MWKCLFLERKKWGKVSGFGPLLLFLANLIELFHPLRNISVGPIKNKNYKNKEINP